MAFLWIPSLCGIWKKYVFSHKDLIGMVSYTVHGTRQRFFPDMVRIFVFHGINILLFGKPKQSFWTLQGRAYADLEI